MCTGPDNRSNRKLTPPGFAMDGSDVSQQQKKSLSYCSILLEFSASDDLISFKHAVEDEGADIDGVSYWYGRRIGSRKMGLEQRTPLLIAALFGSVEVLKYILSRGVVDVNRSCGSDGVTALHCAAAGGSAVGSEIVKLLLDASADMEVLDANGKRAGDVIAPTSPIMKPKELEKLLKGEEEGLVSSVSTDATGNSEDKQQQTEQISEKKEYPIDLSLPEQISEKKEYPIDLSLPDIKNGIYGTDEFRMYTFKVKPCSRAYSHDWTECPFVHPGENARRRDPRKYHYSCVPCPEFRKGTCRQGDACEYAHGVFECWLHPAQYRTRLCKDETGCTRRVCFFAHKKEELRPLYPSTGSAVPSPRGMGSSGSSLDMASMSPLALAGSLMLPTSTPPMSPSSSPSTIGGSGWQNQLPPTLQLPGSRLKASLKARDFELDMDLLGMDGHQQQQLMDEISTVSGRPNAFAAAAALAAMSGSRSGKFNHIGMSPANLDDIFESVDSSSLSQLQGLSLKAAAAAAASASQFQSAASASLYQSPTHARQNMNQQLHSSYGSSLSSSPVRTSSSFGLDPSSAVAAAVMNSRAAAFAKRSQSFSERAAAATSNRHPGLTAMATTSMATPSMLSDWGSPNGKLDWGIQGEELNKLRKSASFATRTSSGSAAAPASMGTALDEPDISWVQSLVKDTPSAGWLGSPPREQQQQYHLSLDEFQAASEMLSPWAEQPYMEQEQMVA